MISVNTVDRRSELRMLFRATALFFLCFCRRQPRRSIFGQLTPPSATPAAFRRKPTNTSTLIQPVWRSLLRFRKTPATRTLATTETPPVPRPKANAMQT